MVTDTDRRGAQVFAWDLSHELAGESANLAALAPGNSVAQLGVPALGPTRLHWSTLLSLRRRLAAAPVAVAHGSSTLVACAAAGFRTGTPFIYRQISDQRSRASTPARRARVSAYLKRPAHVVALWSGAADTLAKDFGVERDRITVIPNGVPARRFPIVTEVERIAARRSFGLPDDGTVVLSIGALVPRRAWTSLESPGPSPSRFLLWSAPDPNAWPSKS